MRGFLAFGRAISFGAGTLILIAGAGFLYFGSELIGRDYVLPLAVALICLPAFAVTDCPPDTASRIDVRDRPSLFPSPPSRERSK